LVYAPIVQAACEAHPDILFCVRFHPNQAEIASDLVSPFKAIEQLPNTRIYYPTDQVNSYSLMEWSDVVVTFGSTITVEACWAGKPVIMLGPSYFDELDVSYTPASCGEFVELLGRELVPKNRENAARFAYYHEFDHNPLRYVKFNGKTLVADGFRVRHPLLGQLARWSDNIICNLIKAWVKRSVISRQKKNSHLTEQRHLHSVPPARMPSERCEELDDIQKDISDSGMEIPDLWQDYRIALSSDSDPTGCVDDPLQTRQDALPLVSMMKQPAKVC
jgi:hypothetical protein